MMAALPVAVPLMLAAPAQADPDTDFANELHTYGIYGQRDYNAWIGKIVCKRLWTKLDADAYEAADFIKKNIDRHSSTDQAWLFLAAATRTYCPDQMYVIEAAANRPANT